MRLASLKIQQKIAYSMALALLLSMVISGWFNNTLTKDIISERLETRELPAILENIKANIEKNIEIPIVISKQMGENQFVIDWVSQGAPQAGEAKLTEYLSRLATANGASEVFLGLKDSGRYFTQKGYTKTMSSNEPLDAWFYQFFASNATFNTGIGPNKNTGELTLFINYKLRNAGNVYGVVGLGRSIDNMVELINNYRIGKSGFVYLVAKDGTIKVHKNTDLVEKTKLKQLGGVASIADELLNNDSDITSYVNDNGDEMIVASRKIGIESLDWYLIAEIPKKEVFAAVNDVTQKTIITNIILAVILIIFSIVIAKTISSPITRVTQTLNDISLGQGDLTKRLPVISQDEVGELSASFNRFVEKLQAIINEVKSNAEYLKGFVDQVTQTMSSTSTRTNEQQRKTELVATAINQMGSTVMEIAGNANEAAQYTQKTMDEAKTGKSIVQQTIGNIHSLADEMVRSSEVVQALAQEVNTISSVLDVIRGISEQTNLLALNAAIEAARAGEQGRGFAVVADEVRTLAQRTHNSIEEIRVTIEKLQQGAANSVTSMEAGKQVTEQGVTLAGNAGQSLDTITQNIDQINDMNHQIAVATEQQSTVTEDINQNVTSIADLARINADDVNQCEANCQRMFELSQSLIKLMAQFKSQ